MAEAWKNARAEVGTSMATVYTCPSGTTALVMTVQVDNVDGTNAADVTARWLDASNSNAVTRLGSTVTVWPGGPIGLLTGPVVLEAGDALQLQASAAGDLEATIAILETT